MSKFSHGHHGVYENPKIRAAGNTVERVFGGWFTRLGEMGGGGGCQVPASGKANDAHFVGIDLPFLGMVACQSDCPLGIGKGDEGVTLR